MYFNYVSKEEFFKEFNKSRKDNQNIDNVVLLMVDGKPTIDNKLKTLITKYDYLTDDFKDVCNSFTLSKKIPNINNGGYTNPFYLIQCKKFSYNTIKYSTIQEALEKYSKDYPDIETISIVKETVMDKGIVWKEVEKNITKALRSSNIKEVNIIE